MSTVKGSRGSFLSQEDLHIRTSVSNCICVQQEHNFELFNKDVAAAYILFVHDFARCNVWVAEFLNYLRNYWLG